MKTRELSFYHFQDTTMFAMRSDQRFSWCAYVPESYDEDGDEIYPLAVLVHGTDRTAQGYRDAFAEFSERERCIVLAPLFPAGIDEPDELHNYKYLKYGDIRFDLILLELVDEISELYRVDGRRFLLTGFSGGGHFTHRFLYAHPERLMGAAVGAPGIVTLLDEDLTWPAGIGDVASYLGLEIDPAAVARVPVQLVIGDLDLETWEIGVTADDPFFIPGVNDEGVNRNVRIRALGASLEEHGVAVRIDVVPGVAHEALGVFGAVQSFFSDILRQNRTGGKQ